MPNNSLQLTRLACGELGRVLPAELRENGVTVARAAGQLSSMPLGSSQPVGGPQAATPLPKGVKMSVDALTLLVSAVSGGLMGSIATIVYTSQRDKGLARRKERATVASLLGELRRNHALCAYNGTLKLESTAAFVRLPTTVALRATFEERHLLPTLTPLQQDCENYAIALLHLNQLMELHDLLWVSVVPATGVDEGAQSRRGSLQHRIADICTGHENLKGVGPDGFITMPSFIQYMIKSIEQME